MLDSTFKQASSLATSAERDTAYDSFMIRDSMGFAGSALFGMQISPMKVVQPSHMFESESVIDANELPATDSMECEDDEKPREKSNYGHIRLAKWNKNEKIRTVSRSNLHVGLRRQLFAPSVSPFLLQKKSSLVIVGLVNEIKPDLTKQHCAIVIKWARNFDQGIQHPSCPVRGDKVTDRQWTTKIHH